MPVEMFTGDDFAAVLNDKLFQKRLTYICVDDAHVIVQRAQFHEEYRNLVFVRRQLPLVQWYFTSATLTKGHVAYLTDFLSLEDQDTTVIRLSNDRPTVQYILREMEYPANTFKDALVFLGPNPTPYNHPGPTIVYCNSRSDAEDLATFLQGVLNAYGPGMERKITWFHSLNSQDHAKKVVGELLRGKYWILVCTEILGMVSKTCLIKTYPYSHLGCRCSWDSYGGTVRASTIIRDLDPKSESSRLWHNPASKLHSSPPKIETICYWYGRGSHRLKGGGGVGRHWGVNYDNDDATTKDEEEGAHSDATRSKGRQTGFTSSSRLYRREVLTRCHDPARF